MKSPSISHIILVHALLHTMTIQVKSNNENIRGTSSNDARLRGARKAEIEKKFDEIKLEHNTIDVTSHRKTEKKEKVKKTKKSTSLDLFSEPIERAPEIDSEGIPVTQLYENPWLAANITQDEVRERAPGLDRAECIKGLFRYIKTEANETVLDYYLNLNTGYCVVIDEPCPPSFGNRTTYSECAPDCLRPDSTHPC